MNEKIEVVFKFDVGQIVKHKLTSKGSYRMGELYIVERVYYESYKAKVILYLCRNNLSETKKYAEEELEVLENVNGRKSTGMA